MPLSEADRTEIAAAERTLLDPTVRADPARLAALLADDFIEIGASGRRYTKPEVIAALAREDPGYEATLTDLEIDELAPGLALTRYRTTARDTAGAAPRHALRTSIWRRTPDGWQMLHHQGTSIPRI